MVSPHAHQTFAELSRSAEREHEQTAVSSGDAENRAMSPLTPISSDGEGEQVQAEEASPAEVRDMWTVEELLGYDYAYHKLCVVFAAEGKWPRCTSWIEPEWFEDHAADEWIDFWKNRKSSTDVKPRTVKRCVLYDLASTVTEFLLCDSVDARKIKIVDFDCPIYSVKYKDEDKIHHHHEHVFSCPDAVENYWANQKGCRKYARRFDLLDFTSKSIIAICMVYEQVLT